MPTIASERVVYYRERAAGMYKPRSFAAAQGIVEIPYLIAQAVAYSLVTYFMIGFEMNASKFFWYFLFLFLNLTCFTYFGIMSINLTPAVQIGTVLTVSSRQVNHSLVMSPKLWSLFPSGVFLHHLELPLRLPHRKDKHPWTVDLALLHQPSLLHPLWSCRQPAVRRQRVHHQPSCSPRHPTTDCLPVPLLQLWI